MVINSIVVSSGNPFAINPIGLFIIILTTLLFKSLFQLISSYPPYIDILLIILSVEDMVYVPKIL